MFDHVNDNNTNYSQVKRIPASYIWQLLILRKLGFKVIRISFQCVARIY